MTPKALSREIKFKSIDEDLRMTKIMQIDSSEYRQFTGLHDKNGKEIYEGDIIKCKRAGIERNCKVIWEDHVIRNDHEGQYSDLNGYETFGGWKIVGINGLALAMYTGQFEVIGNIYENPELLTKENKHESTK